MYVQALCASAMIHLVSGNLTSPERCSSAVGKIAPKCSRSWQIPRHMAEVHHSLLADGQARRIEFHLTLFQLLLQPQRLFFISPSSHFTSTGVGLQQHCFFSISNLRKQIIPKLSDQTPCLQHQPGRCKPPMLVSYMQLPYKWRFSPVSCQQETVSSHNTFFCHLFFLLLQKLWQRMATQVSNPPAASHEVLNPAEAQQQQGEISLIS